MRASEFRGLRKQLGLTQQSLADQLGMSKRQVGRYEAGNLKVPERTIVAFKLIASRARRWPKKPKGKTNG